MSPTSCQPNPATPLSVCDINTFSSYFSFVLKTIKQTSRSFQQIKYSTTYGWLLTAKSPEIKMKFVKQRNSIFKSDQGPSGYLGCDGLSHGWSTVSYHVVMCWTSYWESCNHCRSDSCSQPGVRVELSWDQPREEEEERHKMSRLGLWPKVCWSPGHDREKSSDEKIDLVTF